MMNIVYFSQGSLTHRGVDVVIHIGLKELLALTIRGPSQVLEKIGKLRIHERVHRPGGVLLKEMRGDEGCPLIDRFAIVLVLLSMHRHFLRSLHIVVWLVVEKAYVWPLILQLLLHYFEEVLRAPHLPA